MTTLSPVTGPAVAITNDTPPQVARPREVSVLPEPTVSAFLSGDPLAELMAAMQHAADSSSALSTLRINDTRSDLREKLEAYLEKLEEFCKKLQAAEDDDGGWFSDCFDFVGDIIGEIAGTFTDLQVDLLTLPADIVIDVVKNINDPAALLQALQATGAKLYENGSTAEDVHGFTQGVVSFAADFTEFTARLQASLAKGALTGQGLDEALGPDLKKLWASARHNLLDNPHFWAVVNTVGKGVAVAAAATSAGALAPLAVGLLVLLEADQRYGVIEAAVGKKAAPYVRLGVAVAAAACTIPFGGSSSHALTLLQSGTAVVQGAGGLYTAYRTYQLANEQAEQLEQEAALTNQLNGMQRLQRQLERLLASLEDDQKDHEQTQKLGAALMETKVATDAALIFPA